jgi:hypothetical protein
MFCVILAFGLPFRVSGAGRLGCKDQALVIGIPIFLYFVDVVSLHFGIKNLVFDAV